MLKHILLTVALLTVAAEAFANEKLSALAWFEGHWVVDAFGGVGEEIWLPASGDAMHGVFRLTIDGKMNFSEFIQVTEEDGLIVMRFKHYRPDYSTWENGGAPMELAASEIGPNKVVFEATNETSPSRIVYSKVGEELHVTVTGVAEVLRFRRR